MSQKFAEGLSKPWPIYSAIRPDRLEISYSDDEPSMTRQEFTDECNVNLIMARYEKAGGSGWPPPKAGHENPYYVDFVGMPDLMTAIAAMDQAEEAFMSLPAIVRKEFDNDPVRFVEYAQDPANVAKLREWGLAAPEKVPEPPQRVEIVNAPPIVPDASKKDAPAT